MLDAQIIAAVRDAKMSMEERKVGILLLVVKKEVFNCIYIMHFAVKI